MLANEAKSQVYLEENYSGYHCQLDHSSSTDHPIYHTQTSSKHSLVIVLCQVMNSDIGIDSPIYKMALGNSEPPH